MESILSIIAVTARSFRMGDLKGLGNYILPNEYYVRALELVVEETEATHVVVFGEPEDMGLIEDRIASIKAELPGRLTFHIVPSWIADFVQFTMENLH